MGIGSAQFDSCRRNSAGREESSTAGAWCAQRRALLRLSVAVAVGAFAQQLVSAGGRGTPVTNSRVKHLELKFVREIDEVISQGGEVAASYIFGSSSDYEKMQILKWMGSSCPGLLPIIAADSLESHYSGIRASVSDALRSLPPSQLNAIRHRVQSAYEVESVPAIRTILGEILKRRDAHA